MPQEHAIARPDPYAASTLTRLTSEGGPLAVIRAELVLSRLPIHTLTKTGQVTIHLVRHAAPGLRDLFWRVSPSLDYGAPRQLAYKLDTVVINRRLDQLDKPLPALVCLGTLTQLCQALGLQVSGRTTAQVKHALLANAATFITAKLTYKGRDGTLHRLEGGFTRYSVLWIGERLPTGQPADAIYLVLHDLYREALNAAPVRPFDYDYLKALPPVAQRWYELLSYAVFAALNHGRAQAAMRYAEFCPLAPQQHYLAFEQVKKQMYKVHKPHLHSGYLARVHFEPTVDAVGGPDWRMVYTPGPKARAEFLAFTRQQGAGARAGMVPVVAPAPEARPPAPTAPATALVQYFYQRFHGLHTAAPRAKAVCQAEALIAQHGEALARFVVDYAHQQAPKTKFCPTHFGGLLGYVLAALAAYPQHQARVALQQETAATTQWRTRYDAFVQQTLAHYTATLSPAERARLEAAVRAQVTADRTIPPFARAMEVRLRTDAALMAQAGIPAFDAWQQTQGARPWARAARGSAGHAGGTLAARCWSGAVRALAVPLAVAGVVPCQPAPLSMATAQQRATAPGVTVDSVEGLYEEHEAGEYNPARVAVGGASSHAGSPRPPEGARGKERMRSVTSLLPSGRRGLVPAVLLLCLLGIGSLPWVRLNLSPSVPLGLYCLHRVPDTLTYGQLVLVDAPAALAPWWPRRTPLLKPIAGLPGDVLMIRDGHFFVNARDYGPVHYQAGDRPLPQILSPLRVGAEEVCLASSAPKSLDCRYAGPVLRSALKALAIPLWTWGE